ncbi:serine/threonine transporter SstT [Thermococcus sp. 21S7]|uniref:serine/threonine transporter SstT n=1 Tax=Thermococcus sp. 21S7 TaxID=1638221 RepID=UPI00143C2D60|nr:serine/threonine transporter SstT [Thermococcus sp. 21S7]NJE60258.1 serine/threonine transporter SstT [Thermococcus sp. 21S7]
MGTSKGGIKNGVHVLAEKWSRLSLVKRILLGLAMGIILAITIPDAARPLSILGSLFVGALRAVAPILVFFLVMAAISQHKGVQKTTDVMKTIIILYLLGTLGAAFVAVAASFIHPVTIELGLETPPELAPPGGVGEVLKTLLMNLVDNPVNALATANYIGILAWAILLGIAIRKAPEPAKVVIGSMADAVSQVVRWVVNFAPFGVMGIVINIITTHGLKALTSYGQLIILLVGTMLFVALVMNPLIAFLLLHKNPYPLVFKCLKNSGITAFFTRSSAANIPVNLALCEELGLDKDVYSVSIPLGATINMEGAAITISILALATANTLGVNVSMGMALLLSFVAAISACGTSGVAGGSLLLVPLACSLFGIPNDVAMQVVAIGFIIGVVQDSCETALNSSTDVLWTAVAEFAYWKKMGRELPF